MKLFGLCNSLEVKPRELVTMKNAGNQNQCSSSVVLISQGVTETE